MSVTRYPEEFKSEAVKQVKDRGYKVSDVAKRLCITPKQSNKWVNKYRYTGASYQAITQRQSETHRIKHQMKRCNPMLALLVSIRNPNQRKNPS